MAPALAIANTTLGHARATGVATHLRLVVPAIATVAAEAVINQATNSHLRLIRAKAAGVALANLSRVTASQATANLAVVARQATALLREVVDSLVVVVVTQAVADVAHANRN